MAQSWRSRRSDGEARAPRPLDGAALERLALRYVERYATTRAKLAAYLRRKLKERGWAGDDAPDVDALVERFASLRYVDDASFATARAASLTRRGYGPRRVAASLKAAGIDTDDAAEAREAAEAAAWDAALAFARRKKIGPFAAAEPDRAGREKAFAALLRAGHDVVTARRIVQSAPGSVPQLDQG
ncbi:regulatory protein RecX [Sphingomonas tabacisoli]|uniref:Regulatory protein RecX n=1 Tax=Sphingomonas tabacisoli TaxID=2249466 RepID=A0ABW4I4D5_9SPHN